MQESKFEEIEAKAKSLMQGYTKITDDFKRAEEILKTVCFFEKKYPIEQQGCEGWSLNWMRDNQGKFRIFLQVQDTEPKIIHECKLPFRVLTHQYLDQFCDHLLP